jgi:hypothetical protein
MKRLLGSTVGISIVVLIPGISLAQTAPNAPQYQSGTTNYGPAGSTYGTALNGNTQLSLPTGNSTYVYGQNNSTAPSPVAPGSYGGTVGFGWTYR